MIAALVAASGCSQPAGGPPRPAPAARVEARDVGAPAVAKAPPRVPATSALRCEECHARIAADWKGSPHAGAAKNPLLDAMLALGGTREACRSCHEPLVGRTEPGEPVAAEAVTCDGCHLVTGVDGASGTGAFTFAADGAIKYGPLCDAKDHYFHRMGCSPLHEESRFCGACHEWQPAGAAGPLPVVTDYSDWQASPQSSIGLECQSCHMKMVKDEIARGTKTRQSVHDHGFDWARTLGKKAVALQASVDGAAVSVVVANEGAGHKIPAGMPEHRLVVRAVARDGAGKELAHEERAFGRVLVDAAGQVAPAVRAVQVQSDTRLGPKEERRESFALPAGAATVEVSVVRRRVAAELLPVLKLTDPGDVLLASTRVVVKGARK